MQECRMQNARCEGGWAHPLPQMVGSVLQATGPLRPAFRMTADPTTAMSTIVEPCGVLASKRPHDRDAKLHFESNSDKCFWDGRSVSISVA